VEQTTWSLARSCALVLVSSDGVNYTDVSGQFCAVSNTEQQRQTSETYAFVLPKAIIAVGQREPIEPEFTIVYTETNTEIYEWALAYFEALGCGADLYVRWVPGGGFVGDMAYEVHGPLVKHFYPRVNAGEAGPIVGSFKVRSGGVASEVFVGGLGSFHILLEDAVGAILTEDGFYILQE